jgi:HAD superfamily hydrolase (TIGR01509 family)|uniref:HAD family phosphatase n=1 Tax=Desulfobacca acetoxidans TaxID=60893 RepID=A0A7V6A460_9BACT
MASHYITVLALDLGNVLVKVDHMRFCRRLADLTGLPPATIHAQVFESDLEFGYDTGRLTSQEFHRRVMDRFGVTLPFSQFSCWWNDIFEPMEGMAELVGRLAARYPLYLLSNTNALHFAYIRKNYAFLDLFQSLVLSFEVGSRKPEAAIYQILIARTGRPASQCLYVDDKLPFVVAAREQGLTSWQFTSPAEFIRCLKQHGLY